MFTFASIGRKKDWPWLQAAYFWQAMISGVDILPAARLRLPESFRPAQGWEDSTSRAALIASRLARPATGAPFPAIGRDGLVPHAL